MKLKATKQYHSTPVSKKLASNFIELGYGLQVEGMASEMFCNRSFEPFYPYRTLKIKDYHPDRKDPVQIQLSETEDGGALVLNILDRSEDDGELQLDLTELSAADGEYEGVILHGNSLISMNRSGDAQVTESKAFVTVKDVILYAKIQKLSFYEFVIYKSRGGI